MSSVPPAASGLQFDAAEPIGGTASLSCTACAHPIHNVYHQANGQVVCSGCRKRIEESDGAVANLPKAALYGVGAAVAGAIVYYGFTVITNLEWALVAIAVGFGVGMAVRFGSGGRGGPAFQAMAVGLTYAAIAGAYALLVNHETNGMALAVLGTVELFLLAAKAPFQQVDPLNLLIIGIGLWQAFKLNMPADAVTVTGPYTLLPKPEPGVALAGE